MQNQNWSEYLQGKCIFKQQLKILYKKVKKEVNRVDIQRKLFNEQTIYFCGVGSVHSIKR